MKTISFRLAAVAALSALLLSLSGCVKELVSEPLGSSEQFEFTLDAALGNLTSGDEDTKGSVTTVVRLMWAAGDQVSAINLTTGKALGGSLTANESGSTTTFSGTLSGTVRNGDKIAFLYPSQGYTEEQDYTPVTIDFSNQTGHLNGGVPYSVYSVVTAEGNTFSRASASFKFLMSYLQMNLTGLEANSVIKSVSVDNIGCGVTIGITSTGITSTPVQGTITMTPPSTYKVKSDGTKPFYLSFAESPAVSGRTVTANTANEIKACPWTGSKLNQSTSYTSTLASFVDAPIPFADANFKAYCVQNFDDNSDGEITLPEAGAVIYMSLDADNITSLAEIAYFKNLQSLRIYGSSYVWSDDGENRNVSSGNWQSLPILKGASSSGKVKSLDVSGLSSLISLSVYYTMLETLDVSNLSML